MRVFGNSIAAGYLASKYASCFAGTLATRGISVSNLAVPSTRAIDTGTILYAQSPDDTIVMHGTNETMNDGAGGVQQFVDAVGALAVRQAFATRNAQAAGFTFSAGWGACNPWGPGIGMATSTPGANVSFGFSGRTLYVGSINEADVTGTFSVYVDDTRYGPFTCSMPWLTRSDGGNYAPKLIRITGFAPGAHRAQIVFDNAVGSNHICYFEWACGSDDDLGKQIYAVNVPPQPTYYGQSSLAVIAAYNAALADLVAKLSADGAGAHLIDCHALLAVPSDFYSGPIQAGDLHPVDSGHYKIFSEIYALLLTPMGSGLFSDGDTPYLKLRPGKIVQISYSSLQQ